MKISRWIIVILLVVLCFQVVSCSDYLSAEDQKQKEEMISAFSQIQSSNDLLDLSFDSFFWLQNAEHSLRFALPDQWLKNDDGWHRYLYYSESICWYNDRIYFAVYHETRTHRFWGDISKKWQIIQLEPQELQYTIIMELNSDIDIGFRSYDAIPGYIYVFDYGGTDVQRYDIEKRCLEEMPESRKEFEEKATAHQSQFSYFKKNGFLYIEGPDESCVHKVTPEMIESTEAGQLLAQYDYEFLDAFLLDNKTYISCCHYFEYVFYGSDAFVVVFEYDRENDSVAFHHFAVLSSDVEGRWHKIIKKY